MEKLFERHDAYISTISMDYVRDMMQRINWDARLRHCNRVPWAW